MREREASTPGKPRRRTRPERPHRVLLGFLLPVLLGHAASAQSQAPGGMPPPAGMSLAESAAMRFPQPVRVGSLLHRDVIEYGGFLGFGARPIAVPVDAMVLVGQVMEVVAYTPEQLRAFPTFSAGNATPLSLDSIINVGLAKPSH